MFQTSQVTTRSRTIKAAEGQIKKRAALGDVSNVQKLPQKKPIKAPKTRVKKDTQVESKIPVFSAPPKELPAKVPEPKHEPVKKRVKTEDWEDLDAEDANDPLMVSEYVEEIFDYMGQLELDTLPDHDYMDSQKELAWKMRSILADWLLEVHSKFRLVSETLYLTMNIIDRFLSLRSVSVQKLQLVGVTAMFIAAKYEEIVAPSVQNYLQVVDGYSDEEILKAERYVLQVLDFGLQYPSPLSFLRRCSKADNYDIQTRTLAKYLMEISIIDHQFLNMPPSCIAASGLYLSRKMLNRGEWNANLVHYSGYSEVQMSRCVKLMVDYLSAPVKYEALFNKYSAKKFMKAAVYAQDWVRRHQGKIEMLGKLIG